MDQPEQHGRQREMDNVTDDSINEFYIKQQNIARRRQTNEE